MEDLVGVLFDFLGDVLGAVVEFIVDMLLLPFSWWKKEREDEK